MSNTPDLYRFGMPMTREVWHNAKIDFGAACTFSVFNVVFNQFFSPFAIQAGASDVQVGLLAASPAIGLLLSPLWAAWIEKTNHPKPFVIYPNLIGRLLIVIPAFFGLPWIYVATALLFQLLMGIQAPAYASLISRIYPPDLRGRLMGYVRVAMGLLMIPLAYLVGSWADLHGPKGPLLAAAAIGVISILLFTQLRIPQQSSPMNERKARISLRSQWQLVMQEKKLAIFLIATTFAGFANMLANPLYQIIQVDRLELSNLELGYVRVSYFTMLLLTYFIAGWMLDRIPIKHTLLIGIGAYAVVPMLYGLVGSFPAVIIGSGIQGMGEAIWDIGILAFVFRLAPGREATVFGIHLMLFGIRGTIGPLLGTALLPHTSMTVILLIASACAWIGTILFAVGSREKRGEEQRSIG